MQWSNERHIKVKNVAAVVVAVAEVVGAVVVVIAVGLAVVFRGAGLAC